MQQVTMRNVQFDQIETQSRGPTCAVGMSFADLAQSDRIERERRGPAVVVRTRRSADRLPCALFGSKCHAASFPRTMRRPFAARMRELHAELGASMLAIEIDHACERCFVLVRIKSEATRRDAPAALDVRGLDDHQSRAGNRELAQVHQMPISGAAVDGAVLAHR